MTIIRDTFVVGDKKPDLLKELKKYNLRPIYGPENANGKRPIIGCIRGNETRTDNVNYIEKFIEMIRYADENMKVSDV